MKDDYPDTEPQQFKQDKPKMNNTEKTTAGERTQPVEERKIMTAQQAQDEELIQAVDLLEDAMGDPITPETVIDIKLVDGVPVAYSIGDDGDGTDMPLDELDGLVRAALELSGAVIPTTVDAVVAAQRRLAEDPIPLPMHLQDGAAVLTRAANMTTQTTSTKAVPETAQAENIQTIKDAIEAVIAKAEGGKS